MQELARSCLPLPDLAKSGQVRTEFCEFWQMFAAFGPNAAKLGQILAEIDIQGVTKIKDAPGRSFQVILEHGRGACWGTSLVEKHINGRCVWRLHPCRAGNLGHRMSRDIHLRSTCLATYPKPGWGIGEPQIMNTFNMFDIFDTLNIFNRFDMFARLNMVNMVNRLKYI